MSHPARIYNTREQLLTDCVDQNSRLKERMTRYWIRKWNAWKLKHPGLPLMLKCQTCSGREQKLDRKHGKWKDSKPRRIVKDYADV